MPYWNQEALCALQLFCGADADETANLRHLNAKLSVENSVHGSECDIRHGYFLPTISCSAPLPIDPRQEEENYGDIDHWLEDSGRRTHNAHWVASLYAQPATPPKLAAPRQPHIRQPELLVLFAAAALAYGIQYVIEVKITIAALGGVLVFVALK